MSDSLIQEGTEETPDVQFDRTANVFKISGRSYPENAMEFYAPLISWMESYGENPNPVTNLVVDLEYFNSGSVKQVFKLLYAVEDILETGKEAKITWCYKKGDELMLQKGIEFQKFLDIPVVLQEG